MKEITIKYETLLKNAKKELLNIKKFATKSEIERLINAIETYEFDGKRSQYCIYGAMTGNCYSSRASELIEKCAMSYKAISLDEGTTMFERSKLREKDHHYPFRDFYHSQLEVLAYRYQEVTIELVKKILQ